MGFKKLSDVEVVAEPAESANILIEEDGVIKKAPKTAVGGAGGVEPDLVIAINAFFSNSPTDLTAEQFSIESGSLESVKDTLVAGNIPVVKVKYYFYKNDGYSVGASEHLCGVEKYADSMSFYYENMNGQHVIFMDLSDSSYISYQFTPWAYASGGTVF